MRDDIGDQYGYFGLDCRQTKENTKLVQISGYPLHIWKKGKRQKADGYQYTQNGKWAIDQQNNLLVKYKINTSPGQSGSPIFYMQKNMAYAIGIHNCGKGLFNYGVLLNKSVLENVQKWTGKLNPNFQIFVKTLTGSTVAIQVKAFQSILSVKHKIKERTTIPIDDQRLIFSGMQLENQKNLSEYKIQQQSTLHLVLKLTGSIGTFVSDDGCYKYRDYLLQPIQFNEKLNEKFLVQFKQQQTSEGYFNILRQTVVLKIVCKSALQRTQIKDIFYFSYSHSNGQTCLQSNYKFIAYLYRSQTIQFLEDLKIQLTKNDLKSLIGTILLEELQALFERAYDQIIIRRCECHGKWIKFHQDKSIKTMQVFINDETQYSGGRVVYASNGKLQIPSRIKGKAIIHNNKILHGVTRFQSGVKYSLFLIQNKE